METSAKKSFIQGFVAGFIESSIQRFKTRDGQMMLKGLKNINLDKISFTAQVNAIHALLYDRIRNDENFTLGEILDALDLDKKEEKRVEQALNTYCSWSRNF